METSAKLYFKAILNLQYGQVNKLENVVMLIGRFRDFLTFIEHPQYDRDTRTKN